MINVKNLSYSLSDGTKIIDNLSFNLDDFSKVGLVGVNGIGKSTILKLIVSDLVPNYGEVIKSNLNIAYLPQKFNEFNFNTVADVFGLENQVVSLTRVDNGTANIDDYINLDNHWDCDEVINKRLEFFNLKFDLLQKFDTLSGGEKVKTILSSIIYERTNFLILDEPTNNMDYESKTIFYNFVRNWKFGILLISHDRELLNLVDKIIELRKLGSGKTEMYNYGYNFEQYLEAKELENKSLERKYDDTKKELKTQKQQIIKNKEMIEKRIIQGKKKLENSKYMKSVLDLKVNKSEKKHGQLLKRDFSNLNKIDFSLKSINDVIERRDKIYFKLEDQDKTYERIIFELDNFNFFYGSKQIFKSFNFKIGSKSRIAIHGKNGSGKSTLLKVIADNFTGNFAFLDQEQSFLDNEKTILENVISYTKSSELEARNVLAKFVFRTDSVNKLIIDLSGGERLRVALACVLSKNPDLLMLDEPTNNLDLDSINILEDILKQYKKALIVVSHDRVFEENIGIDDFIEV